MNSRCTLICFTILLTLIIFTLGLNETTTVLNNVTTTINGLIIPSSNSTAVLDPNLSKRRKVLIINGVTKSALRVSKKKSKSVAKARSLLYEERTDKGVKLKTYMMYDLDDVAQFFNTQLETEICHIRCAGDDEKDD